MTRRGLQPDLVGDAVIHRNQIREAGVQHRGDAVGHDSPGALVVLAGPVLPFPPREQIAGAREGRDPSTVLEPGIPADVIDVQVRADHHVDRFGRDTGRAQGIQEAGAQHVERPSAASILVVADARVDQQGQVGRSHHEGMHALEQAALAVEEVGSQPGAMAL
jgi:hypothetical protein